MRCEGIEFPWGTIISSSRYVKRRANPENAYLDFDGWGIRQGKFVCQRKFGSKTGNVERKVAGREDTTPALGDFGRRSSFKMFKASCIDIVISGVAWVSIS